MDNPCHENNPTCDKASTKDQMAMNDLYRTDIVHGEVHADWCRKWTAHGGAEDSWCSEWTARGGAEVVVQKWTAYRGAEDEQCSEWTA